MPWRQVAIPSARAVQKSMDWGRCMRLVHGEASRVVPRGKLRLMALGNGPLECELTAFDREIMGLAGFTVSLAGLVGRWVHREREYLSRASRWCERRVRQRLIG